MSDPRASFRTDARLILAASDSDPNLLYVTRFFAPDPFIFFQHRGKKHLVMNDLELDRARRQAKVDEVMALASVEAELKKRKYRVIDTAAVLRHLFLKRKIRSVLVPLNFPLGLADRLRKQGVRVTPSLEPFFPEREIKSRDEVLHITRAQRAAEEGMRAAIAVIRESRISRGWLYHGSAKLTAEMVRERIVAAGMRQDCLASHTIVACGEQGCDPHEVGRGPLRAHQPSFWISSPVRKTRAIGVTLLEPSLRGTLVNPLRLCTQPSWRDSCWRCDKFVRARAATQFIRRSSTSFSGAGFTRESRTDECRVSFTGPVTGLVWRSTNCHGSARVARHL